jgi:hypothetical protein
LGVVGDGNGSNAGGLALSGDGTRLYRGYDDGALSAIDLRTTALIWRVPNAHQEIVYDIATTADERLLASASGDSTGRISDSATGRELCRLEGHSGAIVRLRFSREARFIATGSHDKTVRLWEVATGREIKVLRAHESAVEDICFLPDGRLLASASTDSSLRLWDIESGEERFCLPRPFPLWSLAFSASGGPLFLGSRDGSIEIWDGSARRELGRLEGHTKGVTDLRFSPDGRILASASDDGTVRLWDVNEGREMARFDGLERYCTRLAWAPSGAFLVSSHAGRVVRFWDTRFTLPKRVIAFSPSNDATAARLVRLLAAVVRAAGSAPLSWLADLLALVSREHPLPASVAPFASHPGAKALASLGWKDEACVALVLVILRLVDPALVAHEDFRAPPSVLPSDVLLDLPAYLQGERCPPEGPPFQRARIEHALDRVDDALLTLLSGLGPQACAEQPTLPLLLMDRWAALPALAPVSRSLLTRSIPSELAGTDEGSLFGALPQGIGRHGSPHSLLPTSLALPPPIRAYRHARGELLYRTRVGRELPKLRPTVIGLDVSPPCQVPPIAALLRPAAHMLAKALLDARIPCFVMLLGRSLVTRPLQHPLDLYELLAARSLAPIDVRGALQQADALRQTLRADDASLAPRIVLFTQTFFGAEEPRGGPQPHVRALFAEYPEVAAPPPWRHHCERWAALSTHRSADVAATLAELLS